LFQSRKYNQLVNKNWWCHCYCWRLHHIRFRYWQIVSWNFSGGGSVKDTRCQMLGEVIRRQIVCTSSHSGQYCSTEEVKVWWKTDWDMVEQIGSLDKVVKYYKKDSEEEFRTYSQIFWKKVSWVQKCKRKL
jgi:peptidyl-prolyl cis-trans isomerase SurA